MNSPWVPFLNWSYSGVKSITFSPITPSLPNFKPSGTSLIKQGRNRQTPPDLSKSGQKSPGRGGATLVGGCHHHPPTTLAT